MKDKELWDKNLVRKGILIALFFLYRWTVTQLWYDSSPEDQETVSPEGAEKYNHPGARTSLLNTEPQKRQPGQPHCSPPYRYAEPMQS